MKNQVKNFLKLPDVLHYYLDSGADGSRANTRGEEIVGGINDQEEHLPQGFQVCNGARLKKINDAGRLENDEGYFTPDFRGRFLLGAGRPMANENNRAHGDGGAGAGYEDGEFYYQHQTGGRKNHQLSVNQLPPHRHGVTYSRLNPNDQKTSITGSCWSCRKEALNVRVIKMWQHILLILGVMKHITICHHTDLYYI